MSTPEQDLLSLFLRLAPIAGVSHAERAIADEVQSVLLRAGIRVAEDDAAAIVNGNTGNLLCFPPFFDEQAPAIILEAHLDTVLSTANLKALVKDDRVTTDGSTILGADNRMGLSILLDLLLKSGMTGKGTYRNFLVAFTVCEETGLYGANALDLSGFKVSAVYVFDCSRRPGIYIRDSVGLRTFKAQFIGKAAHAGVAPEEGVSAIALSAAAISRIKLGRIDEDTTVNIGKIFGGEATNVVADKVTVEGEVRSFHSERIRKELKQIQETFVASVKGSGRVTFESLQNFGPYVHKPDSPAVVHLELSIRSAGLAPQPIRYMGGSDANVFNAKRIPAVNIGIGAQKPHSVDEFFLLEDLNASSRIVRELVRVRGE